MRGLAAEAAGRFHSKFVTLDKTSRPLLSFYARSMNTQSLYNVYMEDHWDYYKDPPIRPLLGQFETYNEAVQFAKNEVAELLDSLVSDPASVFIVPEPDGEHFDSHAYETELRKVAEGFVQRIPGVRKGRTTPAYQHSYHVRDLLMEYGRTGTVSLAGFLHDVVEDAGVELEDLRIFGNRVVELVDLCSHDPSIRDKDARWRRMIDRLIAANDKDAWTIKLADVFDNFRDSHAMLKDRSDFMRDVKIPVILKATEELLGDFKLRQELVVMQARSVDAKQKVDSEIGRILIEVNKTLQLPDDVRKSVSEACQAVLDVNYGYRNTRLAEKIIELHNLMERLTGEYKEYMDVLSLVASWNKICGHLLAYTQEQDAT